MHLNTRALCFGALAMAVFLAVLYRTDRPTGSAGGDVRDNVESAGAGRAEFSSGEVLSDDADAAQIVRTSLVHSGASTVDFVGKSGPNGIDSVLSQLKMAPSSGGEGAGADADSLFAMYKMHAASPKPMRILTVDEKLQVQSHFARLGATPRRMFGLNSAISQVRVSVEATDSNSDVFRASGLVEPLYFYIEIQQRLMGSLEDVLAGRTSMLYTLGAFDYVFLMFGYVHDFQLWIADDVIPYDARPGNIFYSVAKEDDRAAFLWGEFSPARDPSDVDGLWASAINSYNGIFERLREHLERAGALQDRDFVLEVIGMVSAASPAWQKYSYRERDQASAELYALQLALMERIGASAPNAIRAPFLFRMALLMTANLF